MTNKHTTKTNHYFRAVLTALAMLVAILVASGVALAATDTFSNSSAIQIFNDDNTVGATPADPYPSHISVQNLSGNITDVNLKLNAISHTFPDDVAVLLVGPQGQKALLMSDTGGAFLVSVLDPANLTLDDEATNSLPDNAQITSGTYKPTRGTITANASDHTVPANFPTPAPAGPYAADLSVFDGTNPNGSWELYVLDDTDGDAGAFAGGWSLDITTGSSDPQPDATAPKVTSTAPQPGAMGVFPSANMRATFSEEMKASTITSTTFKLFEKRSTTRVGASVSYDAATDKATLDPTKSLKRGTTYRAVVSTDARDLAGNRLDQSASLPGLQLKVWSFKVRN